MIYLGQLLDPNAPSVLPVDEYVLSPCDYLAELLLPHVLDLLIRLREHWPTLSIVSLRPANYRGPRTLSRLEGRKITP
jgi:hypothetical protein